MAYAKKGCSKLKWNGRQIRNAVQTALALAEFRSREPKCNEPPTIKKEDFQTVAKASQKFESYLIDIYGGNNDTDRAHHDQLRAGRTQKSSEAMATASMSEPLFASDSSSSSDDSSDGSCSSESSSTG